MSSISLKLSEPLASLNISTSSTSSSAQATTLTQKTETEAPFTLPDSVLKSAATLLNLGSEHLHKQPQAAQGKSTVFFPFTIPLIVIKILSRNNLKAAERFEIARTAYRFCAQGGCTHLVVPETHLLSHSEYAKPLLIETRLPLPLAIDISSQVKLYMDNLEGFTEVVRQFTEFWCRTTFKDIENWNNRSLINAAAEDARPPLCMVSSFELEKGGGEKGEGLVARKFEVVNIRTARWDNVPLYVFSEGGKTHCRMGLVDTEHLKFKKCCFKKGLKKPEWQAFLFQRSLPCAMFPWHFDLVMSIFKKHYQTNARLQQELSTENALLKRCYTRLYAEDTYSLPDSVIRADSEIFSYKNLHKSPCAQNGKSWVVFPDAVPSIAIKIPKDLSANERFEKNKATYRFCKDLGYTHLVAPKSRVVVSPHYITPCLIEERLPLPLFIGISDQIKLYMDYREGFTQVAEQFTDLWCRTTFYNLYNPCNQPLMQAAGRPMRTARWDNVPLYVFSEGGKIQCRMGLVDTEYLKFKKCTDWSASSFGLPAAMFPLHFDCVMSILKGHYPIETELYKEELREENAVLLRCYQSLYRGTPPQNSPEKEVKKAFQAALATSFAPTRAPGHCAGDT